MLHAVILIPLIIFAIVCIIEITRFRAFGQFIDDELMFGLAFDFIDYIETTDKQFIKFDFNRKELDIDLRLSYDSYQFWRPWDWNFKEIIVLEPNIS